MLGSPSSYMTLQLLHSEFPYIRGKFDYLFYQCNYLFQIRMRTHEHYVLVNSKYKRHVIKTYQETGVVVSINLKFPVQQVA